MTTKRVHSVERRMIQEESKTKGHSVQAHHATQALRINNSYYSSTTTRSVVSPTNSINHQSRLFLKRKKTSDSAVHSNNCPYLPCPALPCPPPSPRPETKTYVRNIARRRSFLPPLHRPVLFVTLVGKKNKKTVEKKKKIKTFK